MLRILRGLGGRTLACGCLIGLYETYSKETIAIVDATGTDCVDRTHRVDSSVDRALIEPRPQPPRTTPTMSR